MIIITTENPGCAYKPLGTVIAVGVAGIDAVKDFMARIKDITGGRIRSYESTSKRIIGELVNEIKRDAHEMGGDAIIGFKVDIAPVPSKGTSMISICVYGTAIKLKNN